MEYSLMVYKAEANEYHSASELTELRQRPEFLFTAIRVKVFSDIWEYTPYPSPIIRFRVRALSMKKISTGKDVAHRAPGHTIPMIDMAKLLAQQQNVMVTIVTTPLNAIRYGPSLNKTRLQVSFLELPFPGTEVGLPEGCESLDTLPSPNLALKFGAAVDMLQGILEQSFDKLEPQPSCIVSDKYLPWTVDIADKYSIPRIVFDGMSCFKQVCAHNLYETKVLDGLGESETFVVPGLPDQIELMRAQLPAEFDPSSRRSSARLERVREIDMCSY
ncbi:hypothetical protein Tco_1286783, partial [Tanacetum coccineum]